MRKENRLKFFFYENRLEKIVFGFNGIDFLTTHINNILSRHSSYNRRQFYDQTIGKSYDTTRFDIETLEVGSVRTASRQFVSIRNLVHLMRVPHMLKNWTACFSLHFFFSSLHT